MRARCQPMMATSSDVACLIRNSCDTRGVKLCCPDIGCKQIRASGNTYIYRYFLADVVSRTADTDEARLPATWTAQPPAGCACHRTAKARPRSIGHRPGRCSPAGCASHSSRFATRKDVTVRAVQRRSLAPPRVDRRRSFAAQSGERQRVCRREEVDLWLFLPLSCWQTKKWPAEERVEARTTGLELFSGWRHARVAVRCWPTLLPFLVQEFVPA